MTRSFSLLSSILAVLVATTACSVERTSSVLGPSTTTPAATTPAAPSMLGTWVVQGESTRTVAPAGAVTALPDFSSCSNLTWSVTNQTATEASGRFSAECAAGLVLNGTITGRLGGATIPLVIAGSLVRGTDACAFSLTGEGIPLNSVTFKINYAGSTCLGPLQGSTNLSLAPHSAPPAATGFIVSGNVTDGTSGGPLPAIEVRAGEFLAVRTDAAGHYDLPGVPAGAATVQFAAAGYVTQTKSGTLSANTSLDIVLQRVAAAPPAGPVSSGNGDQIDMHSVIVRGPAGDVANWPVTTRIRVIDANFGGFFVDFDAKSRWPEAVPPGWTGGIQYTLWLVEKINGRWITAGGVEFWKNLERQGGPPSRVASNWYYNPQVWGELASHQPAPGEQVGFFVTAGDQRAKDVRVVTERSNVVLLPFPSDGGGYFPF